jgi:hypothetical protein
MRIRCCVDAGKGDFERAFPVQYAITAGFLLAVVAGSFAVVIFTGYGIARLVALVM